MAKALIAFDIFSGFRPQHSVEGGSPKKWQALPALILIPSPIYSNISHTFPECFHSYSFFGSSGGSALPALWGVGIRSAGRTRVMRVKRRTSRERIRMVMPVE